ncbi:hypothetical protein ANO11243_089980 [Dothideomycetidae sp. 11243]|nr:hypothetical protein ANO11243_089980 [fungal sp. No.11243]
MICNRCLRAAARQSDSARPSPASWTRSLTSTARLWSTPAPAATSTSAAQPFSEPLTPSSPKLKKDRTIKIPKSSIPAGQRLKGLNLLKGKEDPVAMKDEEYPSWLWTLLVDRNKSSANAAADSEGDLYAKSAKQRRKAAKALRKREAMMAGRSMEPPVPIEEQSVDLPYGKTGKGGDPVAARIEAGETRTEITRALRKKRRASIKETNFLKGVS